MKLQNKRTKKILELNYLEFRKKFKKELEVAFQEFRKNKLGKFTTFSDSYAIEFDFYFQLRFNFNDFSQSEWEIIEIEV